MKLLDIMKRAVLVDFVRCEDGALWYTCWAPEPSADSGWSPFFEFPVPFAETEGAVFLATDTPMFFMRWIRREADRIECERKRVAAEARDAL